MAGALGVLGRVVRWITGIVVALIVLGILLVVLGANEDNSLVSFFTDVADTLADPFEDLFTPKKRKERIALNWGIAAVVYGAVGLVIAGFLERLGR